ncbi:ankyrin repeat protein [Hypsugopox virus]|nr:ankyrin repeat protein [Hypsugopox virus]
MGEEIFDYVRNKNINGIITYINQVNICNEFGETPLHVCLEATDVDIDVLELLLMNGAEINSVTNNEKYTPLFYYCLYSTNYNMDVFDMLVKYGANLNALDESGCTPIIDFISRKQSYNYISFIKHMINKGCNPYICDIFKNNVAHHYLMCDSDPRMIDFLKNDLKIDFNQENIYGLTPTVFIH